MQHFTRKKHGMIPEGQKEEQFPDELEESLPAMLCENADLCQCVMRMREFGKLMHGNNCLLNFNFFGPQILQSKCWIAPGYFLSQGRAFALEWMVKCCSFFPLTLLWTL